MKLIRKIVTHHQPHLDEYLSIFIFAMFGWRHAHFAKDLTYGYIATNTIDPELSKKSPDHLFLGVGGGKFDDHGPKKSKSCSQLVCEFLEICHDARLSALVHQVTLFDKNGSPTKNRYNLPEVIKQFHQHDMDEKFVREWVMKALWVIFESEALLYEKISKEVHQTIRASLAREIEIEARFKIAERIWFNFSIHKIAQLMGDKGDEWLQVAINVIQKQESDFKASVKIAKQKSERYQTRFGPRTFLCIDGTSGSYPQKIQMYFDKASRHAEIRADIVLLRNTAGNTFVGVNNNAGFNLKEFVGILRKAEVSKDGKTIPENLLYKEGTLPNYPEWFVHEGINFARIYNGTHTRPFVDPTKLSFEEIKTLLYEWLEACSIQSKQTPLATLGSAFKNATQ
jgi:hypothetical protein